MVSKLLKNYGDSILIPNNWFKLCREYHIKTDDKKEKNIIINHSEIIFLAMIARYNEQGKECTESNQKLSNILNVSIDTIKKYLRELRLVGLIKTYEEKETSIHTPKRIIYVQYDIINEILNIKVEKEQGYVYIIKIDDYYKIGRTLQPKRRMGEYTKLMKNPDIISLVLCENYKQIEKDLHKMFFYKNTNGEWFTLTDEELNKAIEYLKEKEIKIND